MIQLIHFRKQNYVTMTMTIGDTSFLTVFGWTQYKNLGLNNKDYTANVLHFTNGFHKGAELHLIFMF